MDNKYNTPPPANATHKARGSLERLEAVIEVKKVNPVKIDPAMEVKQIRSGDRHCEILYLSDDPGKYIRRLNADEYIVLATGEIRQYHAHDEKHKNNLARTFRELGYLICANFTANADNQQFLTLTYAENMQDSERLFRDFDVFMKRLKRHLAGHRLEYVAVAEPQGRGAWHVHLLLKTDQPVLFIDWKYAEQYLWGHGQLDGKKLGVTKDKSGKPLNCVDDLGRYFGAYFTSLTNEAATGTEEMSNARKKGARLHFYPKGFKFYRCSQGILRPEKNDMDYAKAVDGWGQAHYVTAFELADVADPDKPRNVRHIQRESYKRPLEIHHMHPATPEQWKAEIAAEKARVAQSLAWRHEMLLAKERKEAAAQAKAFRAQLAEEKRQKKLAAATEKVWLRLKAEERQVTA